MRLIELKDIVKKYDVGKTTEVEALDEIDLAIEESEMIAITGPSGSGKSTLLRIIAGIEKPSSGEYYWKEQNVMAMKEKETCKLRNTDIGIITQDYSLLEEESALFNVCLPQMIGNRNKKENRVNAMKMLDEVGLKGLYHKPTGKLSGGQKQRVAIARALNMNAKIILADELTTLVHGADEAKKAKAGATALFSGGAASMDNVPETEMKDEFFSEEGTMDILAILVKSGLTPSRSEARRAVQQGGVSVDGEKITDIGTSYTKEDLKDGRLVKRGKKSFKKVIYKA